MRKMEKWILAAIFIGGMTTLLPSCGDKDDNPNPSNPEESEVTDYSQTASWYQIPEITKDYDTFYIPATEYISSSYDEGAPDFATLDNAEMLEGIAGEYLLQASVFEESTNVFVPYYRQAGLKKEVEAWKNTGDMRTALTGTPYTDITAALDYYFRHYNGGRPFFIAGHSQGSAMASLVLQKYFKEHPDSYKRMIAAYVIGFAVTKEDLQGNPHLKFATGESDTGVIISWNTEGRKSVEENAPNLVLLSNAISINPLNWKLDDTYAPASENLGSLVADEKSHTLETDDLGADAQVVPSRGVVVSNGEADHSQMPAFFIDIFGPASLHNEDYTFFYNNIKDNVAKRIATYQANM
jgi:pimeloyl-ACP methyl ester carboxylesterase